MSQITQFHVLSPSGTTVDQIQGDTGSPVSPNGSGVITLHGVGGTYVEPGSANTVNVGMAWVLLTDTGAPYTVTMVVNHGYITQNTALTTFNLPLLPSQGDIVRIAGYGAGGWTIVLTPGQSISYLNSTIITSLSSQILSDSVELVYSCILNLWIVISSTGTLQTP